MESNKTISKPSVILKAVLFWLSCAVVLAVSSTLTKGLSNGASIISVAIAAVISFLLTVLFCRWQRLTLSDVGIIPHRRTMQHLLIGTVLGLFMVAVQVIGVLFSGHIKLVYSQAVNPLFFCTNLLLYILIACREEIVFRGFTLRSISYAAGPVIAQTIVAVLFIIEHLVGGMTWPQAILGPGLGAILFGLAALRSRGLALPIGIHVAWNFGQWLTGFKNDTGLYRVITEKGYGTSVMYIGWIGYISAMIIGITVVYKLKEKRIKKENFVSPDL